MAALDAGALDTPDGMDGTKDRRVVVVQALFEARAAVSAAAAAVRSAKAEWKRAKAVEAAAFESFARLDVIAPIVHVPGPAVNPPASPLIKEREAGTPAAGAANGAGGGAAGSGAGGHGAGSAAGGGAPGSASGVVRKRLTGDPAAPAAMLAKFSPVASTSHMKRSSSPSGGDDGLPRGPPYDELPASALAEDWTTTGDVASVGSGETLSDIGETDTERS